MTATTATAYDRAIAYAETLGAEHGRNAAGWYNIDTAPAAQAILRGIADGDPAVLDTLPHADLSGEWSDTLTGPALYRDACDAAGLVEADGAYASFDGICDAYENAFATAAESAIAAAARAILS